MNANNICYTPPLFHVFRIVFTDNARGNVILSHRAAITRIKVQVVSTQEG